MLSVKQSRYLLLAVAIAAIGPMRAFQPARADSPTPTLAPGTLAPATVAATGQPTTAPTPPPTVNVKPERTPVAVVTRAVPTAAATTAPYATEPASVPGNAGEAPLLPSAAQLREDARLRWGGRVPAAVHRWAFLIVPAARKYSLDPNLIAAVMTMESGGDPRAWNAGSDARGLMQVLHGPWDPAQNIDLGAQMLSGFLDQFHDLRLALAAYNAGPGAVIEYGGVPPYRETHDYVIIVTYLYDLYSHRQLTRARRSLYRQTVSDLRRFAGQRKKVGVLAKVGNVVIRQMTCQQDASLCDRQPSQGLFGTMDPFWPLPGLPDPLQRIGPTTS
jgi:soluble lytic murein transglycosylase-like protein